MTALKVFLFSGHSIPKEGRLGFVGWQEAYPNRERMRWLVYGNLDAIRLKWFWNGMCELSTLHVLPWLSACAHNGMHCMYRFVW